MDKSKVITTLIIVATINDRNPTYNTKIGQKIRSNSHGAIPHFVWIEPNIISSGSPTTQGATLPTTTPATSGRVSLPDVPEID